MMACYAGFVLRCVLPILILGMAACLNGCGGVDLKGGHPIEEVYRGASAWPFVPVAMRVHPFTSIEYDQQDKAVVLEARVELLDRLGDTTKGVGDFRFELYDAARTAGASAVDQNLLYSWEAPMTSLEDNRRYYDPITRTYYFKLRLDSPPPGGSPLRLVIQFTTPGGKRLSAEAELSGAAIPSE
jgi:hypothetical protein